MVELDPYIRLHDELVGTPTPLLWAIDKLELDLDPDTEDVDGILEDYGIFQCPGCNWWCEKSEMVMDEQVEEGEYLEDAAGMCEQCAEPYKQEDFEE